MCRKETEMRFEFTPDQLDSIYDMMELNGEFAPRDCFRWFFNLSPVTAIHTEDVEDFCIAFYNAYNRIHPGTY